MAKIAQTREERKTERCACGHNRLMHGGYGCEGIYTGHDTGQFGPEPCGCKGFQAEDERLHEELTHWHLMVNGQLVRFPDPNRQPFRDEAMQEVGK